MHKFFLLSFLTVSTIFSKPLVFYHIPKTAGCTTRHLLELNYVPKDIFPGIFYFELESKRPKDLEKYKLFSGHFFYNSNLQHIDATRITFMRDPVERLISEQRFYKKFYEDTERRNLLAIQHYNPDGDPIENVSNLQVLYLSSLDRNNLLISPEAHYVSALQNLKENFDFVGIVEDYEKSIRSLFELMGWEQMELIPILQSADIDLELDQDKIQEIKERNKFDIMLYEEAKKLFYSKFLVTDFRVKKDYEYVDEIRINFEDLVPGEGFGGPIFFHDLLYRPIVSAGYAFIKVALKSDENFRVCVYANKTINDPNFKIFCNGHDIPYKSQKSKIFFTIPSDFISKVGYTKIEFKILNLDTDKLKWDRSSAPSGYAFRRIDLCAFD